MELDVDERGRCICGEERVTSKEYKMPAGEAVNQLSVVIG